MTHLRTGDTAPAIKLASHLGTDVSMDGLRGHNIVLAFFPLAWTPV